MQMRLETSSLSKLILLLVRTVTSKGTSATVGSSGSSMLASNQSTLVVPCQLVPGGEISTSPVQQQQQGMCAEEQGHELARILTTVVDLAVKHGCLNAASWLLFNEHASAVIDSTWLEHLLHHAVQQQVGPAVEALCRLPAAQAVPTAAVQELVMAAVQRGFVDATKHICTMGGVREIGPPAALKLLMKGQRNMPPPIVELLLESLPAIQQLDSGDVFELIDSDIQHIAGQMLSGLVQLPSATGLAGDQMYKLLRTVVIHKRYSVFASLLLDVPAVDKLGVSAAELLLQFCIFTRVLTKSERSDFQQFLDNPHDPPIDKRRVDKAVDVLFELPGVQQLGATAVHELSAAILQEDSKVVERLVLLPATKELTRDIVQDLVQLAATVEPDQKTVDSLSTLLATANC